MAIRIDYDRLIDEARSTEPSATWRIGGRPHWTISAPSHGT